MLCGEGTSLPYYNFGAPNKIKVANRICTNCGLVFQSPRPNFDELKEYYEGYLEKTQPELADIPIGFEEHILAISRLRLKYLRQFLREGDRLLDIGCSFGAMLKVLKDESGLNLKLVGVNPEQSMAEFGRRNYHLDILVGMFEEQNFTPGSFDFIILDNVLEHFGNPRQALGDIHALLSDHGRLFIATNNLDDPHGFLWQNFFPDHTTTFSPRTLKALLESQGFTLMNQDTSGHTTYEGYRYPYQYCVAEKSNIPATYDFRGKGDAASVIISQAMDYIKSYYKKDGLAKRLYEMKLDKYPNVTQKLKIGLLDLFAKLTGQSVKFQIYNHTLPPEEFYHRRVLVSECKADEDVMLTYKLAQFSGLNPQVIILRSLSPEDYKLQTYPQHLFKVTPPWSFKGRLEFWHWLVDNSHQINEGIAIRLDKADLKEDVLIRIYKNFREKGENYSLVDFRQFTPARLEFLNHYALKKIIEAKEEGEEENLLPVINSEGDMFIWPQREDYYYYYKEGFDRYYKTPKVLSLDLSPFCNKKCDKCQFHSPRSPYADEIKKGEMMPIELAMKILNEAAEIWSPKPAFSPNYSGEPFIYPNLHKVLDHAKKLGFNISVTTNGVALTEEESRYLLDLGIDALLVSVDAVKEETYSLLQSPGDLATVKRNIFKFLELRGSAKRPNFGLHFVTGERNQNEFVDFLNFWDGKADFISRAIQQDQFSACQCILPTWFPLGRRHACWGAWTTLYIRWNGDVSFCGFDIDGKTSTLSVRDKSLSQIWNSKEFWRWRDAQLNGDRSVLYCKACPDWAAQRSITFQTEKWRVTRTPFTELYSPN